MADNSKSKRSKTGDKRASKSGVRTFWSGTLSFGLVNVPVHLFPANRGASTSLRMLDEHGTPLARHYYCPQENRDVHPEHIIRGLETEGGELIIVRDEELEALEPKKTREIDLRRFVDLAEISPMYFERAYYLTPAGDTNKAYRLLAAAMEESGKAGIATFVMRDREYLVAILAEKGILRAQTIRFADELRSPEYIGLPKQEKADRKTINQVAKQMEPITADALDEDLLKDFATEALLKLIDRKRKNKLNVVHFDKREARDDAAPAPSPDSDGASGVDLLESIRRSLQQDSGTSRSPHRPRKDGQLESQSREQLYEQAKRMEIPGRSTLNKDELIRAIRHSSS